MLRWLISTIGLSALKGELAAIGRRLARRAALYALAGLLCLAALAFLLAALTAWIATTLGAIVACCIMAGVLLLVGVIIFVVLAVTRRRHDAGRPSLGGAIPNLGSPEMMTAASIALIALTGYLLGRQFPHR
ncbi:MAG TPA: hypothetical protein VG894_00330 [Bauldia sp.]|nr:hypothetical protein [Bauldia sp.]